MIDFHTHVLPYIDDGAKNPEVSKSMLDMEISQGVKTVLFTPHYYGKRSDPKRFIEKRQQAFDSINAYLPTGLEIKLGAEVHFTGLNMPDFEELCLLAIEGTKYILFEFPFTTAWQSTLFEKLDDFIYETGYTPIIAHVERYREIQKRPALLTRLIDLGCLLQVNTHAFLDKRERKLAYAMMKKGMVHCLGTDAHDTEFRAPDYTEAKAAVEQAGYGAEWAMAQSTMRKILDGETVRPETGKTVKKFFGIYH